MALNALVLYHHHSFSSTLSVFAPSAGSVKLSNGNCLESCSSSVLEVHYGLIVRDCCPRDGEREGGMNSIALIVCLVRCFEVGADGEGGKEGRERGV